MSPINGRRSENGIGLDVALEALSHSTRRRVLVELMRDNPRKTEEFETAEFENVGGESISIELRHAHLPKLDDAGFVDWDPDTGRLVRGEHFEDVRPLLELMDDHREELPHGWP